MRRCRITPTLRSNTLTEVTTGRTYPSSNIRWNKEEFDAEIFNRVVDFECVSAWNEEMPINELVKKLTRVMVDGCDVASRRIGRRPPRRSAYWWNQGIMVIRAICTRSRRKLTRLKRRGPSEERDQAETEYRAAKRALKTAIREAKTKAWRELILTVDKDPWGVSFKVVMKRLRRVTPRITETLGGNALEQLMGSLFPNGETHDAQVKLVENGRPPRRLRGNRRGYHNGHKAKLEEGW